MRNIINIALNEFKSSYRSKGSFILVLILPVFMIFIMGYAMAPVFQPNKGIEKFPVLYVNDDKGTLGIAFDSMIKNEASRFISPVEADAADAGRQVTSGKYDAAILVPKDLSQRISDGEEASIEVISSGKDQVKDYVVRSIVESFNDYINMQNGMVQGYQKYLPQADLQDAVYKITQAENKYNGDYIILKAVEQPVSSRLSSFQYFTASMLLFFMLTVGIGVGSNILSQRAERLYARISTYPVKRSEYLMGHVLSNIFLAVIQAVIVILATRFAFNVNWGSDFLGIGITIMLAMLLSSSIGVLFSSIINSPKAISSGMVIVIWMIAFISGGFSPIPALEPLGRLTFYRWAFDALTTIMAGGGITDILNNLALLAAAVAILWTAALILYRRRVSYE